MGLGNCRRQREVILGRTIIENAVRCDSVLSCSHFVAYYSFRKQSLANMTRTGHLWNAVKRLTDMSITMRLGIEIEEANLVLQSAGSHKMRGSEDVIASRYTIVAGGSEREKKLMRMLLDDQ